MTKLHVGCGPQILPGWVNLDNVKYPGVDKVVDVTKGLPYKDVSYGFAEHFIEHLAYDDALKLMRESRRVLRDDGVLRLSTPNLDWVWVTHYRLGMSDTEEVQACFALNRAFRGWGHQFLYNVQTLTECLHDAGFAEVEAASYGESRHEELRGIERHEKYADTHLPHIVIVEASGVRREKSETLEGPMQEFREAISVV